MSSRDEGVTLITSVNVRGKFHTIYSNWRIHHRDHCSQSVKNHESGITGILSNLTLERFLQPSKGYRIYL